MLMGEAQASDGPSAEEDFARSRRGVCLPVEDELDAGRHQAFGP